VNEQFVSNYIAPLRHPATLKKSWLQKRSITLRRLMNEATRKRNDFRRRYEYVKH